MAVKDKTTSNPALNGTTVPAAAARRPQETPDARTAQKKRNGTDGEPQADADQDLAFQKFMLDLLKLFPAAQGATTPEDEFAELTAEMALQKGILTPLEVLRTHLTDPATNNLKVGIVSNRDSSESIYLVGRALENFIMNAGASPATPQSSNFRIVPMSEARSRVAEQYVGRVAEVTPGQLNPDLAARMKKDPQLATYVNYAIGAGQRAGIDGVMYANQLWQESRFNPNARSGKDAGGIAQMMPHQVGKYGLQSAADIYDPYKSMDAGARMMADLTNRYKDQRLALVAYNGGGKAIDFVESKLGKSQVSFAEWQGFMEQRRATLGDRDKSAWHVETLHYTHVIAGRANPEPTTVLASLDKPSPKPG